MSNASTWLISHAAHPSGDTKPCAGCGRTIYRTSHMDTRAWRDRRYCTKSCAATATNRTRAAADMDQTWRSNAACRDSRLEFVPDTKAAGRAPAALCHSCPVRAACLAYGVATRQWGVWGGRWLDPWATRARRVTTI
jgi:hypothetical protein